MIRSFKIHGTWIIFRWWFFLHAAPVPNDLFF